MCLTPVTIGGLTVTHLPVAIIDQAAPDDTDMILGMDFMSRVHTWFSFSSKTLILQYPFLPSPHLPFSGAYDQASRPREAG